MVLELRIFPTRKRTKETSFSSYEVPAATGSGTRTEGWMQQAGKFHLRGW